MSILQYVYGNITGLTSLLLIYLLHAAVHSIMVPVLI